MRKHIPNIITLLNLAFGSVALFMVLNEHHTWALLLLLTAAVFDFFDGFVARLLKAGSELGKQLDSLADLVSFGLVPAAMIFMMLQSALLQVPGKTFGDLGLFHKFLLISIAMVPVMSALRLAKFNLQKDESLFFGIPTPAFAIFWTGIYYDMSLNNSIFGHTINAWIIWGLMLLMSFFMILPLPMLSLKFQNFNFQKNIFRYILLILSAVLLIFTGIPGLSLVILTYILLSLVKLLLT
ncbi:CDP-alcohol phosphatidyltransferase family protein [Bacteroidota bacterium]